MSEFKECMKRVWKTRSRNLSPEPDTMFSAGFQACWEAYATGLGTDDKCSCGADISQVEGIRCLKCARFISKSKEDKTNV